MFGIGTVVRSLAASAIQQTKEEEAFQNLLAAMPEDKREDAIKNREAERQERVRKREHDELVEAVKPHTLWSFLGLGRK